MAGKTIVTYGTGLPYDKLAIPKALWNNELVSGAYYEVFMETTGVPDPQRAIDAIRTELPTKFPVEIVYIAVVDKDIRIQFKAHSPVTLAAIIAWLPLLLAAIGIVMVLIAVFLMLAHVPTWVWGLLAVGALLVFFTIIVPVIPAIPRLIPPKKE